MIDEYIEGREDQVKNRDGLTELLGDKAFVIPAIQIANAHRGTSFLRHMLTNKVRSIV